MLVPYRHKAVDEGYRYGFNGKEKDDEVMGEGNWQDYGMRMYNPRIGRFFNIDPLTFSYPELTPYQFANNTPVVAIDLDGLESWYTNTGEISEYGGPLSEKFRKENKLYASLVNINITKPALNKINEDNTSSNINVSWNPNTYFETNFMPTLLKHEGGYQNKKSDSGNYVDGELIGTNLGISAPVLKEYLGRKITVEDMKNLTKEDATAIYKDKYWNLPKVGEIKDKSVALQYADMYVNSGGNAVRIMQRALNSLGEDVTVDGAIGKQTLDAINRQNGEKLHEAYKKYRIEYYEGLHKKNPTKYSEWINGWKKRANSFKYEEN